MASSSVTSPTFLPSRFLISAFTVCLPSLRSGSPRSGLDLDVDTRRQVELHERVERLLRRLEDVEQALVRADLELLARLLVDVRRAEHAVLVDLGRERDGARNLGARALGRVHDLPRR